MASGAIVEHRWFEMCLLKEPYYAYAHYYIHDRLLGHIYGLFTPLFKVLWGDFQKFFLEN